MAIGRRVVASLALGVVLGGPGLAQTITALPGAVTVRVGPVLAAKVSRLGQTDVNEIVKDLSDTVGDDLKRRPGAKSPVRADLVLEDAIPNRPTAQQLGDHPGLSERSIALGGATISGVVTFADGHTESLSYSFTQDSLRDDIGIGQWTDADRAFAYLGNDLAHGHIPHDRLDLRVADSSFDPWRP
jgi:hypothetical protein